MEEKYIWEVPCNLCYKPRQCKVIKETEKTYIINVGRILKSRMNTGYVRYFESEDEAWKCYNTNKEQERNKDIAKSMIRSLENEGRFVLEYELIISGEYSLKDYHFFEAKSNTDAKVLAKEFIKKKNAELVGEYIQKTLSRLVLVSAIEVE